MENPFDRRYAGYSEETRDLSSFQVMRRTVGTDLQGHGTMKDAQQILRHASIKTTAEIYIQEIQASVCSATKLTDAGDFPPAEERTESTGEPGCSPEKAQFSSCKAARD
jgi:hypothetical protein